MAVPGEQSTKTPHSWIQLRKNAGNLTMEDSVDPPTGDASTSSTPSSRRSPGSFDDPDNLAALRRAIYDQLAPASGFMDIRPLAAEMERMARDLDAAVDSALEAMATDRRTTVIDALVRSTIVQRIICATGTETLCITIEPVYSARLAARIYRHTFRRVPPDTVNWTHGHPSSLKLDHVGKKSSRVSLCVSPTLSCRNAICLS